MADIKLRVHARADACFPDPNGSDAVPQRRRIVGRTHKEVSPGSWAWVRNDQPDTLDYHHDLVKAVRDGDLWPADEATAKACGVKFDPKFGGEIDNKAGATGGKGDV